MPKVYMMCGRICSGKSTHAAALRKEKQAVVLSVDDLTMLLLGPYAGDKLDEYVEKLEGYFYQKSLEIIDTGINVILDWGFWTRRERDYAREFYGSRNIEYEFHFIDVEDTEWHRRIDQRNQDILEHKSTAYYVDEGLAAKFESVFEPPEPDEQDIKQQESNDAFIH